MAGEIFEVIDEVGEEISEEADDTEEMEPAEREEFEEEIAEAKANVEELSNDAKIFRDFVNGTLKSFGIFVLKNAAIGAILFGVNVALSKLIKVIGDKVQKDAYRRKQHVLNAINQLIKSETDLCKTVKDWLHDHKDDEITVDGLQLKLEAIFETKLDPISDAIDKAYIAAKRFIKKKDDQLIIPTADDVRYLLDASDPLLKGFDEIRQLAEKQVGRFPSLQSLLDILSQIVLDQIRDQLDVVKNMQIE